MRKYLLYILSVILLSMTLISCGSSTQDIDDKPAQVDSNAVTHNQLVFDSYGNIYPFPNDILWKDTDGIVDLTSQANGDPQKLALYTAIKALKIKGLSPATPIAIPLANNIKLDPATFENNLGIVDITSFVGYTLNYAENYDNTTFSNITYCQYYYADKDNETLAQACFSELLSYYSENDLATLATIVQNADDNGYLFFDDIEIKQNANVLNIYPLKPFEAGHQYLVVIGDGIKDVNGNDLLPSPVYTTIRNTDNCSVISDSDLQTLCSSYQPLWDLASAVTFTSKENLLEVFTFTTADKTLSVEDFGVIQATLDNASLINNYDSLITGYKYSDLILDNASNEFIYIDQLSDLPLVCQNSYDNITLRTAFNLPIITDNLSNYIKTPNLYALNNIEQILTQYNFPDNQSNIPFVCKEIFDNSSLYDNVTMDEYNDNLTNPNGIVIYQHGLGKDKSDASVIAQFVTDKQIYAIDLPWHGDRVLPTDLTDTSCYENVSGSCYLTDNPIYDRLNLYQSLLDMHTLTKFLGLSALQYNLPLYFAGQSMGSITGSMLLNLDNVTISQAAYTATSGLKYNNFISKAVLNVGGAGYAALLNEATNSLITDLLSTLNLEKHSLEYYITLGVFQLLLDPVDPIYFANNPSINSKVLLQSANGDTIVPNVTNKALALAYNYDNATFITDNTSDTDSPIANPVPGWYMFGKDDNWVNHGFLIHTLIQYYPEAADYLNQAYVDQMQDLARKQLDNFLNNNLN
ncbi:hypothetical protein DEFDS_1470 [Deferribacter desulfuricans SSM1]|uniref:Uncharacterized protein n=1 Tax=Deferribacter desulfuricans (strain DSM 14783 / JCM 11476 / NBRC 101012 / SSM1) TaxID=639282 RepID=D3PEA7_DEFDS|nr:Ig-like domain-containing protein [Deferribacter desulfuricans]BAI80930.1 hypothetical protein DEFDS_1470 [Deferribacter desulfuricans SSM1]